MTPSADAPSSQPQNAPAPAPAAAPIRSALLDEVETKSYGTGNVTVSPDALARPIPEASWENASPQTEADPFMEDIARDKKKKAEEKKSQGAGTAPGGGKPGKPGAGKVEDTPFVNPDLQDLGPDQKQEAAANMAKMVVFGYVKLNEFADKKLQISHKRVLKLYSAGKIDPACPIPVDAGRAVSFAQFVDIYNEQIKGTLTVEQEFKDDVLPVLTRVLAKRGHGFSDEQYLMYTFGTHMVMQGQKFMAQQSTLNAFMKYGTEMTDSWRQNRPVSHPAEPHRDPVTPAYTPHPQQPQQAPPPHPQPQQQPASTPPSQAQQSSAQSITVFPGDPLYEEYMNRQSGSAVQQQSLPVFGSAEALKALKKHSKKLDKAKGRAKSESQVSAGEPPKRKRIPSNSRASKSPKGDA